MGFKEGYTNGKLKELRGLELVKAEVHDWEETVKEGSIKRN